MLTRDDLIRDQRTRGGSFFSVLFVYGILVGTLVLTGMAVL
ncbi:hypothetical protein [Shimia sp. R10_1]|nr:hypothetical protein [Shimia sp. R10_1]